MKVNKIPQKHQNLDLSQHYHNFLERYAIYKFFKFHKKIKNEKLINYIITLIASFVSGGMGPLLKYCWALFCKKSSTNLWKFSFSKPFSVGLNFAKLVSLVPLIIRTYIKNSKNFQKKNKI